MFHFNHMPQNSLINHSKSHHKIIILGALAIWAFVKIISANFDVKYFTKIFSLQNFVSYGRVGTEKSKYLR